MYSCIVHSAVGVTVNSSLSSDVHMVMYVALCSSTPIISCSPSMPTLLSPLLRCSPCCFSFSILRSRLFIPLPFPSRLLADFIPSLNGDPCDELEVLSLFGLLDVVDVRLPVKLVLVMSRFLTRS